jgi:hypothetical protein
MGLARAAIKLSNPCKPSVKPIAVTALVDTTTPMLRIPKHIAKRLELTEAEKRVTPDADGNRRVVSHVGPILIRFENRKCLTGALVMGSTVRLGSAQLLGMDVVLAPSGDTIIVNPASPNIPSAIVKRQIEKQHRDDITWALKCKRLRSGK